MHQQEYFQPAPYIVILYGSNKETLDLYVHMTVWKDTSSSERILCGSNSSFSLRIFEIMDVRVNTGRSEWKWQ